MTHAPSCRLCGAPLRHVFVDLGMSPLSNSYLTEDQLGEMEPFYPLRVLVCDQCFLVQLEEFESPERMFSEYAYFSSYSSTWLEHCRAYTDLVVDRFGLDSSSHVIEIASNDGYLLQYFAKRRIPVLGIEPAANVASAAQEKGIPTVVEFFGRPIARRLAAERRADLLVGNNVLAHVPDLNDFVAGLKILLAAQGVITMEFPHLLRLIEENQFDTIYHEHFSYFSFLTARRAFAKHGLELFDVEEIPTHGGSLRVYACHADDFSKPETERAAELARRERELGLDALDRYLSFGHRVYEARWQILDFLIARKREEKTIVGYGAPAKGNTLLNFCGIRTDLVDYTVDLSPHKQGRFLPGTHVPVRAPDAIAETRPDFVLILPWNLKDEIIEQMSHVREWGGRFVTPIPELRVHS